MNVIVMYAGDVPHQPRRVLYRVVFPSLFNRENIQTGSRERWSKLFFFFLRQKGVKLMHLCGDQIGFTAQTKTNVLQTLRSRVKGWLQTSQKEPKRGVWRLNRRKSLLAIIYLRVTSADSSAKKGTAVWFVCSVHFSCGCGRENHLTVVFGLTTQILDFSVATVGNSYSPVSFRQLFSKL